MNVFVSSQPASEPITAAEVEQSLALTSGWDAETIAIYIAAARIQVEKDTNRSIITQTLTMKLDKWPEKDTIHLPFGSVASVSSVKYFDTNDTQQTLVLNTGYKEYLSGDVARIDPIDGWPSLSADLLEPVEVIYVAGTATATLDLKSACIAKVDMLYSKGELHTSMYYEELVKKNKIIFDYSIND